ncbi:hypothetical protein AB0948_00380 [Streptomyces koyangensis]|uniref:hypothetical protein n=1 Tax=Streptomyces koyangensis TaxID=188770 RepID=UPI0034533A32
MTAGDRAGRPEPAQPPVKAVQLCLAGPLTAILAVTSFSGQWAGERRALTRSARPPRCARRPGCPA